MIFFAFFPDLFAVRFSRVSRRTHTYANKYTHTPAHIYTMEEYAREPCPYRIVDDCGGAFAMGCIGGGVFQAIKGFRNAPSGFTRRMVCHVF